MKMNAFTRKLVMKLTNPGYDEPLKLVGNRKGENI
jgi:hypothetical protein